MNYNFAALVVFVYAALQAAAVPVIGDTAGIFN
jgi:hypothetical protein